jgi:hypothetical protein
MGVDLSWSGTATVRLRLLDHKSKTLAETTVTGTSLHMDVASVSAGKYSLTLKLSGPQQVTYTLTAGHC